MKSFNVIYQDYNTRTFSSYDVIPYLVEEYKKVRNKPKTKKDFLEFIEKTSMRQWWARCEYEIIISGWPNQDNEEKWDIHKQVMMNLDVIADVLIKCVLPIGS